MTTSLPLKTVWSKRKSTFIRKNLTHPSHSLCTQLPSGWRVRIHLNNTKTSLSTSSYNSLFYTYTTFPYRLIWIIWANKLHITSYSLHKSHLIIYLFQAALQIITLTIKDKQLIFILLQDIALADLCLLCLLFVYNLYVVCLMSICLLFLNAKCLLQVVP